MAPANNNIYKALRDKIVTVRYKPGDPLNELRLADEFGVSRTPIREALIRLTADGFVNLTPRLGARVSDVNLGDFKALIEYRVLLEKGLAALLVEHVDSAHIHRLERLYETVRQLSGDQVAVLMNCDTRYHRILRSAVTNPWLDRDLGKIQMHFTRIEYLIGYIPKRLPTELPKTIDALKKGDSARLQRLIVGHVHFFVKQVKRSL